jgi:hypothetical protein
VRISEKTIELNFCAQATAAVSGVRLIWFGLTQKQEAKYGFDACTKLNGRLLILQFKASNNQLKKIPARRFTASHNQMGRLQQQCNHKRSVFYVFPLVGTTLELAKTPNLLAASWLLDVASLPSPMPPPTTAKGKLRKTGSHYVDVYPTGVATIHSEPFDVELILARDFFVGEVLSAPGLQSAFQDRFVEFWNFRQGFGPNSVGLIVVSDRDTSGNYSSDTPQHADSLSTSTN